MSWYILISAVIWALSMLIQFVDCMRLPPIHWNSSNTMFKTSNNNHLVQVNMDDEIDFVCPYYPSATESHHHEYYVIHRVSRRAYQNCILHDQFGDVTEDEVSPLLIVNCSQPHRRRRFTLLILEYSPIPNVPEFREGETYYFITTSTGYREGLDNSHHGACHYKNMKLTIEVCCKASNPSSTESSVATSNPPYPGSTDTRLLSTLLSRAPTPPTTTLSTSTITRRIITSSTSNVRWRTTQKPTRKFTDPIFPSTVKSDDTDKDRGQNEVIPPHKDSQTSGAHRKHRQSHLFVLVAGLLLSTVLLLRQS